MDPTLWREMLQGEPAKSLAKYHDMISKKENLTDDEQIYGLWISLTNVREELILKDPEQAEQVDKAIDHLNRLRDDLEKQFFDTLSNESFCGLCNEKIVFKDDDEYKCPRCEEIYCQSCYMDLPDKLKHKECAVFEEDDDYFDEQDSLCVCCQYDITWEEHPKYVAK